MVSVDWRLLMQTANVFNTILPVDNQRTKAMSPLFFLTADDLNHESLKA